MNGTVRMIAGALCLSLLATTVVAPSAAAEHCWSLGAEAGPVDVIYNPCGTETEVDTSPDEDDDDVTVHRGYDEITILELP